MNAIDCTLFTRASRFLSALAPIVLLVLGLLGCQEAPIEQNDNSDLRFRGTPLEKLESTLSDAKYEQFYSALAELNSTQLNTLSPLDSSTILVSALQHAPWCIGDLIEQGADPLLAESSERIPIVFAYENGYLKEAAGLLNSRFNSNAHVSTSDWTGSMCGLLLKKLSPEHLHHAIRHGLDIPFYVEDDSGNLQNAIVMAIRKKSLPLLRYILFEQNFCEHFSVYSQDSEKDLFEIQSALASLANGAIGKDDQILHATMSKAIEFCQISIPD